VSAWRRLQVEDPGDVAVRVESKAPGGSFSQFEAVLENGGDQIETVLFSENRGSGLGGVGTNLDHPFYIRTNDVERMRIDTSGNVGIGTADPGAKLEVAGQIKVTGGSPGNGKVLTSDANGLASWQAGNGCNWNGWKCHCNADKSGAHEGHVILGVQCLNGVVNNFKIFEFQVTGNDDSCPASCAGCDIYSRY